MSRCPKQSFCLTDLAKDISGSLASSSSNVQIACILEKLQELNQDFIYKNTPLIQTKYALCVTEIPLQPNQIAALIYAFECAFCERKGLFSHAIQLIQTAALDKKIPKTEKKDPLSYLPNNWKDTKGTVKICQLHSENSRRGSVISEPGQYLTDGDNTPVKPMTPPTEFSRNRHLAIRTFATVLACTLIIPIVIGIIQFICTRKKDESHHLPGYFLFNKPTRTAEAWYETYQHTR